MTFLAQRIFYELSVIKVYKVNRFFTDFLAQLKKKKKKKKKQVK